MNIQDVEKLADLARLELSDDEKTSLLKDFDSILAYVDMIRSADTDAKRSTPELYNVWREDAPRDRQFSHDLVVGQFPEQQDGFLKVKKIL